MESRVSDIADHENRRRAPRARTLKGAHIVLGGGYSIYDCVIRNLSATGAMLAMSAPLGVPSHFEIMMDAAKQRRPCTVRWRSENAIGVSFDDAELIANISTSKSSSPILA
jgi:hypothetical protein